MQIFREQVWERHWNKHYFVSGLALALILGFSQAKAFEYNEKLPAIAPPSASFTESDNEIKPNRNAPHKAITRSQPDLVISPIPPPKPTATLTPTSVYNQGALAYQRKDFEAALKHWTKASEMGVLGATWWIAHMHHRGIGTAVDKTKAFTYFSAVAEKHKYEARRDHLSRITLDALVYVGIYYRAGLPEKKVKPDPEKALKIFRYAASHGQHPVAQYHLGDMYVSGNGVKANGPRGMRWMNLAAKKNHSPSLAALGELYWQGKVVDLNKSRALMFFDLAVHTSQGPGKNKFKQRLAMLKATATEQEIIDAQKMVIEWIERYHRRKK